MSDWSASQYLKFKNQRTQPAEDLARRITTRPKPAVDIGCGPGNSTATLKKIFPDADIVGIDNSLNMIKKAEEEHPDLKFELCDALTLTGTYDLLFSNACLQWIPNHKTLIPELMTKLNDGGILAVQIPMNGEEPLFRLIKEIASEPKWGLKNSDPIHNETLTPTEYFDLLSECSSAFDMWEIKYYHPLDGHRELIDWVKGTRIRPYLDILGEEKGKEFEKEIFERSLSLYPTVNGGKTILGFRRFFFIAKK